MELKKMLENEIKTIVELLYQQNIKDAYPRLIQMLPKMEQFIAELEGEQQGDWLEVLKVALEAMEQQDATLLADVLQYEILERMNEE